MSFWNRLRVAVESGIIVGVKVGVAALIVIFAVGWFLRDYEQVRTNAGRGDAAFQYIDKSLKAQQQQAKAQVAPPSKE